MIECIAKIRFKDCAFLGVYQTKGTIYFDTDTDENWTFDKTDVIICNGTNRLYAFQEEDGTVVLISSRNYSGILFENYEEFIFHNPIKLVDKTPKSISNKTKDKFHSIYKEYKKIQKDMED